MASRVNEIVGRLRERGHRLTPQRYAVVRALVEGGEHPSVVDPVAARAHHVRVGAGNVRVVAIRPLAELDPEHLAPDRFTGDKQEATARMIEINEANEVVRRLSLFGEESNDIPPSFDPLDHDWGIALRSYPDLTKL